VRKVVLDEPLDGYTVLPVPGGVDGASVTAKPATSSAPSTVFIHA